MSVRDWLARRARAVLHSRTVVSRRFPDFDPQSVMIHERVRPYTMTTPERVAALCEAVRYVERAGIPGAFVECGVWRGGSSMAAAYQFKQPRPLYLFDTFEGMPPPSAKDVRIQDRRSAEVLLRTQDAGSPVWGIASLEDVRANMRSTGYPEHLVTYVQGRVEETIPERAPGEIAILRLDTDWYESTKHELEHLYPRLSVGGVLIVDDYGCWAGARDAVDEYFADRPVLLHRIDREARLIVKPRVHA